MNATPLSGTGLTVHCTLCDAHIAAVAIAPRRIVPVERLAVARTPTQIPTLFANLLALCPDAHALAASNALAAAQAMQPPAPLQNRREARAALEIIKEHSLNLLLQQPASELAPHLLSTYQALRTALGGTQLYAAPAEPVDIDADALSTGMAVLENQLQTLCGKFWRLDDPTWAEIERWQAKPDSPAAALLQRWTQADWAAFGRCRISRLPLLPEEDLHDWLAGAPTLATPTWKGMTQETGAYARQADTPLLRAADHCYGNGLYSRLLARLVEIKALFRQVRRRMCDDVVQADRLSSSPAHGIGLSQVEASRGRLIHRVVLAEGRVQSYQVLAPTEWNFHPQGLLHAALLGVPVTADLPERIEALIRTVDPCVEFHITLSHE